MDDQGLGVTEDVFNIANRETMLLALVPIAGIPIEAIGCDTHRRHIGICLYKRQLPRRAYMAS
jgi:hypothetical protein